MKSIAIPPRCAAALALTTQGEATSQSGEASQDHCQVDIATPEHLGAWQLVEVEDDHGEEAGNGSCKAVDAWDDNQVSKLRMSLIRRCFTD
jgi:hypothetical protein